MLQKPVAPIFCIENCWQIPWCRILTSTSRGGLWVCISRMPRLLFGTKSIKNPNTLFSSLQLFLPLTVRTVQTRLFWDQPFPFQLDFFLPSRLKQRCFAPMNSLVTLFRATTKGSWDQMAPERDVSTPLLKEYLAFPPCLAKNERWKSRDTGR